MAGSVDFDALMHEGWSDDAQMQRVQSKGEINGLIVEDEEAADMDIHSQKRSITRDMETERAEDAEKGVGEGRTV